MKYSPEMSSSEIARDILTKLDALMDEELSEEGKAKGPGMGLRYRSQERDALGRWGDEGDSTDKPGDGQAEQKMWKDIDSQIDKWDDTFGVETKGSPQQRMRTWLGRLKGIIPGRTHKNLMDMAHDTEKRGLGGEEIADYVLRFQKLALFVSAHQDEIRQLLQGLF